MSWYRDLLVAALIAAFLVFSYWALQATGGAAIDIPPSFEGSQPTKELHNARSYSCCD